MSDDYKCNAVAKLETVRLFEGVRGVVGRWDSLSCGLYWTGTVNVNTSVRELGAAAAEAMSFGNTFELDHHNGLREFTVSFTGEESEVIAEIATGAA